MEKVELELEKVELELEKVELMLEKVELIQKNQANFVFFINFRLIH